MQGVNQQGHQLLYMKCSQTIRRTVKGMGLGCNASHRLFLPMPCLEAPAQLQGPPPPPNHCQNQMT